VAVGQLSGVSAVDYRKKPPERHNGENEENKTIAGD